MNTILWTAFSLFLVLEGFGPMFFPNFWRKIIKIIIKLPNHLLRRYGGILVISGIVIYTMIKKNVY